MKNILIIILTFISIYNISSNCYNKDKINKYENELQYLRKENSKMRVIKNENIKLINYNNKLLFNYNRIDTLLYKSKRYDKVKDIVSK